MIKRIVKLTFRIDAIADFETIFEESKDKIKAMQGCHHVELLQDTKQPNVFFTFSIWEDENALDEYRSSLLFEQTWAKTKALFADKPQAWSVDLKNQAQ